MVSEVLRLVARGEMVPHAEKEIVVGRLHDAAAEMIAAGERPVLVEDHRDVFEPGRAFVHQPGACKGRARARARQLGVAEINRLVASVIAVDDDVVQAALARREDLRDAGECGRELAVPGDDAQAARALGDQHSPVGQECERPGMIEALGHGLHHDVAGSGCSGLRLDGRCAERQNRRRARACRRSHANGSHANVSCARCDNDAVSPAFQQAQDVHIGVTAMLTFPADVPRGIVLEKSGAGNRRGKP
jgi:hypothetical protein